MVWLGATRTPGQFVEFCKEVLVSFVAGMPPTSTVKEAVRCFDGPITMPDATPVLTPALSPFESGTCVLILCAGAHIMRTL